MSYSCEPCDKTFNGINPYTDHMKSLKHMKKVDEISGIQQITELNQGYLDLYISRHGSNYKCHVCNIELNSIQQMQNHVSGKKHQSSLTKKPFNLEKDKSDLSDRSYESSNTSSFVPSMNINSTISFQQLTELNQDYLDQCISRHGSNYKCHVCNIELNSIQQIQNHVSGKKHQSSLFKKPLNLEKDKSDLSDRSYESSNISSFVPSMNINSTISFQQLTELNQDYLDQCISRHGSNYKCHVCNIELNSIQQIQNHVSGKKHQSSLFKKPLNLEKDKSDMNDRSYESSNTSNFVPSMNINSTFSFRDIKIENILSNIKVFNEDEQIYF